MWHSVDEDLVWQNPAGNWYIPRGTSASPVLIHPAFQPLQKDRRLIIYYFHASLGFVKHAWLCFYAFGKNPASRPETLGEFFRQEGSQNYFLTEAAEVAA